MDSNLRDDRASGSSPKPGAPARAGAGRQGEFAPGELAALRRREPAAMEKLYDLFFDRIYGYVRRLVRDEATAEDVTQDVFLHIQRSISTYDPERPLRPWVFAIATNKVRDVWHSRGGYDEARRELSSEEEENLLHPVARELGPLGQLERSELHRALERALEEMPESLRATLFLRSREGLSFRDIGELLSRSEIAVRKRYSRGLRELRERLAKILDIDPPGAP